MSTGFHDEVRRLLAADEEDRAATALEARIREERDDAWAHLYLATLLPAGDAERISALARQAARLAPDDLELLAGAVEVLLDLAALDEAKGVLQLARHSVTADTEVALAARLTGQGAAILALEGDYDQALRAFTVARQMEPDNPRWATSSALILQRIT